MLWVGVLLFVMADGNVAAAVHKYQTEEECERGVARMATIANAAAAVRSFSGACMEESDMTRKKPPQLPPPSTQPPKAPPPKATES